ncbi:hypothetical protein JW899_03885 [Candidatus Uhrbacteria bacterium]|nr:hypothetical protein [Candidatus Uhrbacteria bacterium]
MVWKYSRWLHRVNERRVPIFFVGLAGTLVILAAVWQGLADRRTGFGELTVGDRRLEGLLPVGAETVPDGFLPLDALPQATAVGYSANGKTRVALVVPDAGGRLAVADDLDVSGTEPMVSGIPQLFFQIFGPGASPAIGVRSGAAFDAAATAFVLLDGRRLVMAERIDGSGRRHPAVFYTGNVLEGYENFSLRDLTDDGLPEAIVEGRYVAYGDGTPGFSSSTDVYVWRNGAFAYDSELSRVMTLGNGLFPEPEGE